MPGTIKAVQSIEVNDAGEVQFICATDEGGTEMLTCPREMVSEILLKISTFNMGLLPKTSTPMPQPHVSYEGGTGRVALSMPFGADTHHLVMGHHEARVLANDLKTAADLSVQKPGKKN